MSKKCSKCKSFLEIEEFWKDSSRPDGFRAICRSCDKQKGDERRQRLALFLNRVRELGCKCCNEKEICCIDLHHVGSEKKFDINLICKNKIAFQKVIDELSKCTTVCSNCHRKIHKGILSEPEVLDKDLEGLVEEYRKIYPRTK